MEELTAGVLDKAAPVPTTAPPVKQQAPAAVTQQEADAQKVGGCVCVCV